MSSASARVLEPLCIALNTQGHNASALLQRAGIDPNASQLPGARISEEALRQAWHLATQVTGDDILGLKTGINSEPHSLGILGYVLNNAANVRQAYALLTRYRELVFDEALFNLEETADSAVIQLRRNTHANAETSRPLVEYLIAVLLRLCGTLTGGLQYGQGQSRNFLQRIEFRYQTPSPELLAAYQQHFKTTAFVFGANETALVFDPDILDYPVAFADPDMLKLLTEKADAELKSLATESQIVSKVKAILRRRMLGITPSIIKVAEDCAMSRATLQRHLAKADTSFQQLLDSVRQETAAAMLADDSNSISHIAFVLGYADSAAFHHAYKRWTGITPTRARANSAANQAPAACVTRS